MELGFGGHYRRPPGSAGSSSEGLVAGVISLLVLVLLVAFGLHGLSLSHRKAVAGSSPVSASSSAAGLGSAARIVQVASFRDRPAAEAAAGRLRGRGLTVGVLNSLGYAPLRAGFYVVYVGPYPRTAQGTAATHRVSGQLPGSMIRDVHSRPSAHGQPP